MSYILDALKKSEKERKRGKVPDILAVQDTLIQRPKKRLLWPYIFLIALLINAGLLAWWLSPLHSKKPVLVAQSTTKEQNESNANEPLSNKSDGQLPVVSSPPVPDKGVNPKIMVSEEHPPSKPKTTAYKQAENEAQKVKKDEQKQVEADMEKEIPDSHPAPTAGTTESHELASPVPQQSPEVSHTDKTGLHTDFKPEPGKVYEFSDLPSSVKQGLPDFNISSLVYSNDPSSRMVRINGQLLREGQNFAEGFKLLEIIPDGVIVSSNDFRFHIGIR
jgi:general secretion pathway protein B